MSMWTAVARAVLLAALSFLAGCAATPPPVYEGYSERLPCVDRVGRCFDAFVNGQPIVVLPDTTLRKSLETLSPEARDLSWRVTNPIPDRDELTVETRSNTFGLKDVGDAVDFTVKIYPLDGQRLLSDPTLEQHRDVRVEGSAAVTRKNVLRSNRLPTGRYLLVIRFRGSKNWDRKTVYVEVR